jgi:hypothetical protein
MDKKKKYAKPVVQDFNDLTPALGLCATGNGDGGCTMGNGAGGQQGCANGNWATGWPVGSCTTGTVITGPTVNCNMGSNDTF